MTVLDLLIMGVAGCALVYFLKLRKRRPMGLAHRGFSAIVVGLSLIALFYFADLLVMHVLPRFVPTARAMALMTDMHLEFQWFVWLAGVGFIGFGLIAVARHIFALVGRLEISERNLKRELDLREESEGALRESEARLTRAQQQAKLGYWRWSFAEQRLTYWSEETARLCGYSGDRPDIGYDNIMPAVHPDERERVLAEYRAADAERRGFEIEYRVLTADGEILHIREVGEVEFDANGEPVAQVGTVQDLTELKKTEAALRKSEASLANAQRIARLGH
jgi:PAS domain S-box-containing protein